VTLAFFNLNHPSPYTQQRDTLLVITTDRLSSIPAHGGTGTPTVSCQCDAAEVTVTESLTLWTQIGCTLVPSGLGLEAVRWRRHQRGRSGEAAGSSRVSWNGLRAAP
jgi:hypothetical protein